MFWEDIKAVKLNSEHFLQVAVLGAGEGVFAKLRVFALPVHPVETDELH